MKKFSESEKSEIIELALSDHASFENIKTIYGIGEKEVKKLMKKEMKYSSYKLWWERVYGRKTKHLSKRSFVFGRHKSPNKR